MKRFYCTVCKKVKRVQRWPILLSDAQSTTPHDRIGECNWHVTGVRHIRPSRSITTVKVTKPVSDTVSTRQSKVARKRGN